MSERIPVQTRREELRAVTRREAEYPAHLRDVPDAPEVLYVRGALRPEDALAVAVVGSRRATTYGMRIAETLACELAARGIAVVSGLARGIDGAAHRGALRAGGRTIAVLGSGVDVIYPPEHRGLAAQVAERGALISPFAAGTPPLAYHFPARNRVIAGMVLGIVVVEAAERSGALITARLGAELGREVMAVPGPVTSPVSHGAHALIRDGATLVRAWEDVVAELPLRWRECVNPLARNDPAPRPGEGEFSASEEASAVLGVFGDEPMTIDAVIERSGLGSGRAAALLLELELDGRVRQLEGKRFVHLGRG